MASVQETDINAYHADVAEAEVALARAQANLDDAKRRLKRQLGESEEPEKPKKAKKAKKPKKATKKKAAKKPKKDAKKKHTFKVPELTKVEIKTDEKGKK